MVTHTRNWSSAFNPSKCTHTEVSSEHTHCEHTPGAVGSHYSSARGAIGGSVPCSRSPQSWYWRWRECCSFTIPTFNPCRTWDSNPQRLDYKSDSLTIRPRLPWATTWNSLKKFFFFEKSNITTEQALRWCTEGLKVYTSLPNIHFFIEKINRMLSLLTMSLGRVIDLKLCINKNSEQKSKIGKSIKIF